MNAYGKVKLKTERFAKVFGKLPISYFWTISLHGFFVSLQFRNLGRFFVVYLAEFSEVLGTGIGDIVFT